MAERHTKSISLRRWQLFKSRQGRSAELLGSGKRELLLGFVPNSTEQLKPRCRIHRVAQQGGLANSGLPVNHDRAAATGARRVKDPIEPLALVSSPEQHRWGLL
jgi:hypothetical protein